MSHVRRRASALALALLAAATLVALRPDGAGAASPAVYTVTTDGVSSARATDPRLGSAAPSVLAQAGDPLSVHVSFTDVTGAPTSFTKDTLLRLSATTTTRPSPSAACVQGSGTTCRYAAPLVTTTGTAPKGLTSATLVTSTAQALNNVQVSVTVADAKAARGLQVTSTHAPFDVLRTLQGYDASAGNAFRRGIGGTAECTEATPGDPVCGIAILPNGSASSVVLSQGACDTALNCRTGASVVQLLSYLGDLYDASAPATLLLKCDKTLCGTGAIKAIPLRFSLSGNGSLTSVGACPSKGTAIADTMCVDYVQSTRDGSGDTLFYLLFTRDARVSIG